jgi:UDP-N-acetylglucosamine acyltransferase
MSKIYQPSFIHPTAVIGPNVTIGKNVYIGPLCVIGYPAEWKGNEDKNMGVWIGDGARITKLVTIDSGVEGQTKIGPGCYIMAHSHVGHDALLCGGVTLSPGAVIGGHATIGFDTNIGINASIHQRVDVPQGCMIGMSAVITKKTIMEPYKKLAGVPAKIIGDNNHG